LVAAAKFSVATTKILSVVPNFVAVTKPFFSVQGAPYDGCIGNPRDVTAK